jgi:subtilisin-like proprotein convertase family protein
MKKIIHIAISLLLTSVAFSQFKLNGTNQTEGTTLYLNSGTLTDGNTGNMNPTCNACTYDKDEDISITICPSNFGDVVKLTFTFMDIEMGNGQNSRDCKDYLYVYQNTAVQTTADDIFCGTFLTGDAALPVVISTHETGCLTLRFDSDGSGQQRGWAITVSNVTPCKNPTARIANSGTALNICPSTALNPTLQPISFDGSGSTPACTQDFSANANDNTIGNTTERSENITALSSNCYHNDPATTPKHALQATGYNWNWGDGTVSNNASSTQTHSFANPGVYSVTLRVRDNNTDIVAAGCESANEAKRIVNVVPPPALTNTNLSLVCNNPLTTSVGSTTGTLSATAETQTEAEVLPTIETTPTSLPDGTGASYVNSVNYGGYFPVGSTVNSPTACYPTVQFSLEHSWAGDLWIDLVAPDGKFVRLFNRVGGQNKFGTCSNALNTDAAGGCPATYTVVPSGGVAWPAAGNATYTTTTTATCGNYTGTCEAGYYIRPNFNYAPATAFTNLNGAPLNGSWTIRITDNQSLDNGKLFDWNITFPEACFKPLTEISPIQNTLVWSNGNTSTSTVAVTPATLGDPCPTGATCDGNRRTSVSATIGPYASAGSHDFTYVSTDQYGCEWEGTATVTVACLLPVELVDFYAHNQPRSVELNWSVASERDNDYFTIEKSKDGLNFDLLENIDSKVGGNTTTETVYSALDNNPDYGLTYYRLSQTDFNGNRKELDIKTVDRSNIFGGIVIKPNPVQDDANIIFSSSKVSTCQINIYDLSGKLLYKENVSLTKGLNEININTKQFANGLFYLELSNDEDSARIKFIKN